MWFKRRDPFSRYPDAKIIINRKVEVHDMKGSCFVVEFPPAIRPIMEDMLGVNEPRFRKLAFPYVYIAIFIVDGDVWDVFPFFRNTQATKEESHLYHPNLPNLRTNGSACMYTPSKEENETLEDLVGRVIENFWTSVFNHDLQAYWEAYKKRVGFPPSFAVWEHKSKEDPGFIAKLRWIDSGLTLDTVVTMFS